MANAKFSVIQTEYKGYLFRSRLEARWALFFDECNVAWEYEPEGYVLGEGIWYLPDFLLHGVFGFGDVYVEVKGSMKSSDSDKVNRFCCFEGSVPQNPVLVLAQIPDGWSIGELDSCCMKYAYEGWDGLPEVARAFSSRTLDGCDGAIYPCVTKHGEFALLKRANLAMRDNVATEIAYRVARQSRFDASGKVQRMDYESERVKHVRARAKRGGQAAGSVIAAKAEKRSHRIVEALRDALLRMPVGERYMSATQAVETVSSLTGESVSMATLKRYIANSNDVYVEQLSPRRWRIVLRDECENEKK